MINCKARQYSDQMQCATCGLTWDVNDPDPPPCLTDKQRKLKRIDELRRRINVKPG